jgi:hypothetical protein
MLKNLRPIIFAFILLFTHSLFSQTRISNQSYIDQYRPLCDSLSAKYGIPSLVILGIGIYESDYGNSKVCRLLNNHHGLAGKNNLLKTHGIKSRYKQFETDSLGYVAFCEYVAARKYYQTMPKNADIGLWLTTIGSHGYCQNPPIWKKHILQILSKNKLI